MNKVAGRPFCVYTNTLFLQVILRVSHAKQALLILREHLGSPPDFSGVTASVYLFGIMWPLYCLFFYDLRLLITSLVSCGHCIVCSSTIYGFWLPLWYLVAIVLSVLLWYTASDYTFCIFKVSFFPHKIDVRFVFIPICFICYMYWFTFSGVHHNFLARC